MLLLLGQIQGSVGTKYKAGIVVCLVFLVIMFYFLISGKVYTKFGRVIYREQEPRDFWNSIILGFITVTALLGYLVYKYNN